MVPRGITIQELAPKLNRTHGRPRAPAVRRGRDGHRHAVAGRRDDRAHRARRSAPRCCSSSPARSRSSSCQALLGDDEEEEDESLLEPRAPVVTVMGHVDHGKTTLLDRIRDGERRRGRSRWHHAAHRCVPGRARRPADHVHRHARSRGVHRHARTRRAGDRHRGPRRRGRRRRHAADDRGDQPRRARPTCRSSSRSRRSTARTPTPTRVRQQLVEQELVPEEWGGDTIVLDVAAPTGSGRRRAARRDPARRRRRGRCSRRTRRRPARAFVLESNLDSGRGPVVTAIVERGTLRVGEPVVAGGGWGRVRAMFDEHGQQVHRGRPVDAGRGARPRRRAARRRRAAGRARRQDRPHRRRGPRAPPPRGEPRRTR